MSFSDTIFLFFLALILFGPKKLPGMARQAGRLLADLRRASNEFKSQIETEIAHLETEKPTILPPSPPPQGTVAVSSSQAANDPVPPQLESPVSSDVSADHSVEARARKTTARKPRPRRPVRILISQRDQLRRPRASLILRRRRSRMFDTAADASGEEPKHDSMPTMGFLDHLEELRRRLVYSIVAVAVGFFACWGFREKIYAIMQKPIMDALKANGLTEKLVYLNPIDPFNLYLKIAALAGLFLTSPFVLYQVWMFISPGLYRNEKRYVVPFMASTIALFSAGGYFGYRIVYPRALDFLIGFGSQFQPMITISEYTSLFLSIILGMGLIFEMPILIFFLALMGIVSAGFMWKNFRYAILIIFIVAGIVTPSPDPGSMCIFAAPMVALYGLSIGIAWLVHPKQRQARRDKQAT